MEVIMKLVFALSGSGMLFSFEGHMKMINCNY